MTNPDYSADNEPISTTEPLRRIERADVIAAREDWDGFYDALRDVKANSVERHDASATAAA